MTNLQRAGLVLGVCSVIVTGGMFAARSSFSELVGWMSLAPLFGLVLFGVVMALTVTQIIRVIRSLTHSMTSGFINAALRSIEAPQQPVQVEAVVEEKARSMRCKSCGAVSVIEPGEPEICAYCGSPL